MKAGVARSACDHRALAVTAIESAVYHPSLRITEAVTCVRCRGEFEFALRAPVRDEDTSYVRVHSERAPGTYYETQELFWSNEP